MFNTLNDALIACTKTSNGIVFIKNADEDEFLSYADLYKDACKYLAFFQEQGVAAGDELILQFTSLKELMQAYWACLLGGIVPVPLALADQGDNAHKVFSVWNVLQKPWLAIDNQSVLDKLKLFSEKNNLQETYSAITKKFISSENISNDIDPVLPQVTESDVAFIQFSSGSTGNPKGVVLTHKNLLVNIADILASVNHESGDSFLSWKPISHDFGMIAFHLAPIVALSNQYRIPTDAYIWSPSLWFSSVNKYRASILGSPNFGYRHFLNLYKRGNPNGFHWDLSCVKAIFNGAEPISAALCQDFHNELAPYGLNEKAMRPGYGLAEASLIVSLCKPDDAVREISVLRNKVSVDETVEVLNSDDNRAVQFVDCGVPYPSTQVRITNQKRTAVAEAVVGNIEIKGENVTAGYYQNAAATKEVLTKDGWLNTQDLGFMLDGRLYVVGRTKEMIIIGGVNYFPQDIEKAILRETGESDLNRFIACGIKSPITDTEQLIIFVYHKKGAQDFSAIQEQVKKIVLNSLSLQVAHVVPVKRIPKTTSGKVRRFALVQAFNEGAYDAELIELGQPRHIAENKNSDVDLTEKNINEKDINNTDKSNLSDIRKRICNLVTGLTGKASIDPSVSFFDAGLTSLKLVLLQEQVMEEFDVELSGTSTLDNPTIEALTQTVFESLQQKENACAIDENKNDPQEKLNDAIAIIGMACRFPGDVNSPEDYWTLLTDSIDPVAQVPDERWKFDGQSNTPLTTNKGGFLKNVDQFDPYFFGISPVEAEALDPQQRLLLEVCHEGFENAGFNIPALNGSNTGVFLGISGTEYSAIGKEFGHSTGPYTFTGSMFNTAAGRISYAFGLQGPCIASDTACSSSLVAVHQATTELKSRSCDLAIAAAVSLILKPDGHISFSRLNALSPSGQCRSFDDSADGYIRSEGCAAVVLKRLQDAERDGDNIFAVIRGSAINHNGRSGGLTVPSGLAQEKLVRKALQVAGLQPDDVDYVEAHGSGTKLGDPQEAEALKRVFGSRSRPLWIGSVKSNMGHLESAAGMAGLIKLTLSLNNKTLVPNLHFSTPNKIIDWKNSSLKVVDTLSDWPQGDKNPANKNPIGAISSFGISGTNVHLIAEAYVPQKNNSTTIPTTHPAPFLFTLSSKSPASLHNSLQTFSQADLSGFSIAELCRAVNFQRSAYAARYVTLVSSVEELQQKLQRHVSRQLESVSSLATPNSTFPLQPKVFLYTGQGSHYAGMAESLYQHSSIFKTCFDECDKIFKHVLTVSLVDCLYGDKQSLLEQTHISQALIFSIEYSLTAFWKSLGITPDYVIGHSIGEYAAACAAGIINLQDAVAMVALRGNIMHETVANGKMVGVLANREQVESLIRQHDDVFIAAVNTEENFTIAGAAESVDQVIAAAKQARIFTEALPMTHAFHTPLMKDSAALLAEGLSAIHFNAPNIPMLSTKTGQLISSANDIGVDYWREHLCTPVLFADAICHPAIADVTCFIEIGGTATLTGLTAQILTQENILYVPSLRQGRDAWLQISESIAQLYKQGAELNWLNFHGKKSQPITNLPNTQYARQSYWFTRLNESGAIMHYSSNDHVSHNHISSNTTPNSLNAANNTKAIVNTMIAKPVESQFSAAQVIDDVRAMVSQVTGVAEAELDDDVHLFSLGVDSLMLVQLDKRITGRYQVEISMGEFFMELHTPKAIATHIFENLPAQVRAHFENSYLSAQQQFTEQPAQSTQTAQHSIHETASTNTPVTSLIHHTGAANNSAITAIVQNQLAIMQQQLQLLQADTFHPQQNPSSAFVSSNNLLQTHANVEKTLPEKKLTSSTLASPVISNAPVTAQKKNIRDIVLEEENINAQQKEFVKSIAEELNGKTASSKIYAEQHRDGFADWIATLNFTLSTKEFIYPLVAERSKGSRFWDIDGNEYIDTAMGYGVCLFGHNPDFIADAVQQQLTKGVELGPQSALAGKVAELIRDITGVERVAFANTGTEAVMVALRLARAVTGRHKIVRFITSFHGSFDGVLAEVGEHGSEPMAPGIPQSMVDDTIVLHYGAEDSLQKIRAMSHEIAAVIVEPVQSRNPGFHPHDYLQSLRAITSDHNIALVFDEMVTGFRCHPAGAQAYFGVNADLITYGKIVGGGMPIGVVAGKAEFMNAIDGGTWRFGDASGPSAETTFFAGTFCKHPLTMAAAHAVLTTIKNEGPALQSRVTAMTENLVTRLNRYFEDDQVPIKMKMFSSMYRFESGVSQDLPRLSLEMNLFFRLMQLSGVFVWERRTCFFSTAHTDDDANKIFEAVQYAVKRLREGGFSFRALNTGKAPVPDSSSASSTSLSAEERRLYVLSRMNGGDLAYKIKGALAIKGTLDEQRLKNAVLTLTQRHESLRTHYEISASGITRIINPQLSDAIEPIEYTLLEGDEKLDDVIRDSEKVFSLDHAPLWAITLIRKNAQEHVLLFDFHHLIADGRSISIIVDDLVAIYQGENANEMSAHYSEYVQWQNTFLTSDAFKKQKDYWLSQLNPLPLPLELPCDYVRPPQNDFAGAAVHFEIAQAQTSALKTLAKEMRVTPFMLLFSVYFTLIHKLSQQQDICIGVPFDLRANGNFENTVGMFAQTLILRINAEKEMSFAQLLEQVRHQCAGAYSNANVPLDKLIDDLNITRELSRNPLFDAMFIYETGDSRLLGTNDLQIESYPVEARGSAFDITLEITEERGCLRCSFIYATRLFSESTINNWKHYFENIINHVVASPQLQLADISVLDNQQVQHLLQDFNNTARDFHLDTTLHQLFTQSANNNSEAVALTSFAGEQEQHLTYQQLDAASDHLARHLIQQGVRVGDMVGVLLKRDASLIISLLAVLKTGAAYVPLDPDYPQARLEYMLERAAINVLLSKPQLREGLSGNFVLVDPDNINGVDNTISLPTISARELAYVIFTSGSTGHPKGVMLEHRSVVNFVYAMFEKLQLPEQAIVLGLTTLSFDIFVLEVFATLIHGGRLVLANEQQQQNPVALSDLIKSQSVNVVQMTPSRLKVLLSVSGAQESLQQLKRLLIGGEAFPAEHLAQLQAIEGLRIFNMYGPTETSVWSLVKELTAEKRVTLGQPIANTRVYILDAQHALVPSGVKGELFIAGTGLARGYLHDQERTAQMFRDDPFFPGEKMYATGDVVSWTQDGELTYHGRRDNQIKLRGYRIELQDIEAALIDCELVDNSAVVMRELSANNPALIAFYTITESAIDQDKKTIETQLRSFLRGKLPEYMVPSMLIPLAQLPLTPNGKIDRNSLPHHGDVHAVNELHDNNTKNTQIENSNDDGADEVITRIRAVWEKVLAKKSIELDRSFFDVGGNSFSLMLVHAGINEFYPDVIDVTDMFANPTIRALHHLITQRVSGKNAREFSELRLPEEFFDADNNSLNDSYMQIKLDQAWVEKARSLALKNNVDNYDLVLAMKALYLNKFLKESHITLHAPAKNNQGFMSINVNFDDIKNISDLLNCVHEQRAGKRKSLAVVKQLPTAKRQFSNGVISLFRDRQSSESKRLNTFDMVYSLDFQDSGAALRVDFNKQRLCEKKMNGFVGGYIQLMKAVVEAS